MKFAVLLIPLFLVGCDKALHGAVGFGVSAVVTDMTGSPQLGCAAAAVAGVAKEIIDPIPDPFDIAATIAGGCIPHAMRAGQ